MKNLLLILCGAGLGIVAYILLNENNPQSSFADQTGAWGIGKQVSGAGNSVVGSLKEGFGKLTGDEPTRASGLADKAKGAVQDAAGSVAQKVSDVTRNA